MKEKRWFIAVFLGFVLAGIMLKTVYAAEDLPSEPTMEERVKSIFKSEVYSLQPEEDAWRMNNVLYIEDQSFSMTDTFSYERNYLMPNLKGKCPIKITMQKSNMWAILNSYHDRDVSEELSCTTVAVVPRGTKEDVFSIDYKKIVLVSDLWDTSNVTLKEASNMELVVLVPFWSKNEEAREHVTDVVKNDILKYWRESIVYVVYLDGERKVYHNLSQFL